MKTIKKAVQCEINVKKSQFICALFPTKTKKESKEIIQKLNEQYSDAVVTRYFGGIKLGAGGLVRAYSKSVMEAVGEAEIVEIEEYDVYQITFEYSNIKTADAEVRNNQLTTINKDYTDKVSYEIVSKENRDIEKIFEKYSGEIIVEYKNKQFLEKI